MNDAIFGYEIFCSYNFWIKPNFKKVSRDFHFNECSKRRPNKPALMFLNPRLRVYLRHKQETEDDPNYWTPENWEVIPSPEPIPHKCKPVILQIPRTENNEPTVAVKIEQDEITKPLDEIISLPEVGKNEAINMEPTDEIGNKVDNSTGVEIPPKILEYLETRIMKKHTWVEICNGKLFCQVNLATLQLLGFRLIGNF